MTVWRLVAAVAVFVFQAALSAAQEERLPEFVVQRQDGAPVTSEQMAPESKWLLIYLNPSCRACDTLMRALPKWQTPALMSRLVLVVGGKPAEAAAYVAKSLPEEMAGLRWYHDADRAAAHALELIGAPMLFGVQDGEIEWQLGGVLNDPAALESVVRSWVEPRR